MRLVHVGVHNSANRNAGDTLLFPVVRRAFDVVLGPFNWELRQAWEPFDQADATRLNNTAHGLVIGGGGLLLRDQAGSDVANSGWQWNSTVAAVRKLNVPTIVFAIGYNRFRGQEDFDPIFSDHITAVVKKSVFFGLRNTGSIRSLRQYLSSELEYALQRQYCPTTALWQLYPEYQRMALNHDKKKSRVIAFNAAFDRTEMRFGNRDTEILRSIANAIKLAETRGWEIQVVAHKHLDRQIEPYLDRESVTYETVDLTNAGPEAIMSFYAQIDFAVGMRGHAQMIPFGLRRPIMSLISHDKMRYFLEDIEHPEWGVEVDSPRLAKEMEAAIDHIETARTEVHATIRLAQTKVWKETVLNLHAIGQRMEGH